MKWLVTTSVTGRKDLLPYVDWLKAAGVESLPVAPGSALPDGFARCDALLLSGGDDVDPALFGQPPHGETKLIHPERDRMEIDLVARYRRAGRPVFGICRGIQVLQVALGGPLVQHVPDLLAAGDFAGERHEKLGKADAVHELRWLGPTRLGDALHSPAQVNSAHHQAVDGARLAPGLRLCATSPGGIVEAVEGTDDPLLSAVQWHPERLKGRSDPAGRGLLDFWVATVRSRR